MRIAAYLNAGTPPKRVAKFFVEELLHRSDETGNGVSLEVAVQFVQSNLTLIGFQCDVTTQQVKRSTFQWPESLRVYYFPYNVLLFRPFESFLRLVSNVVLEKQQIFDTVVDETSSIESSHTRSPISYLLGLLDVWYKVYTDLEGQECNLISRRFEEPMARITCRELGNSHKTTLASNPIFEEWPLLAGWNTESCRELGNSHKTTLASNPIFEEWPLLAGWNTEYFNILLGLYPLWKQYRLGHPRLDAVCQYLYHSALKGIFYPECHKEFITSLSELFTQDFEWFVHHSDDPIDLFYEALSVSDQNKTHANIFETLEQMISNSPWTSEQLLVLTNCLIEEKMQEVYFTNIKFGKSKFLILNVLKFIKTLANIPTFYEQIEMIGLVFLNCSNLPTVECFSKPFVEVLWIPLLKTDKQISSMAAETYIYIMKRKFNDTIILKHILEGYFQKKNSTESLEHYVEILYQCYTNMTDIDVYINVIAATHTADIFRAYTAHFLVEIYKLMQINLDKCQHSLVYLFLQLPQLLKQLSCQTTVGVLLQIYQITDFKNLKSITPEKHLDICHAFEDYAVSCFTRATYDYPIMLCIFAQLNRCIDFTENWALLEDIACTVYIRFREIENKLNTKKISKRTVNDYNIVLQQLSLLLKTGYSLFDDLANLLVCVQERLINTRQIYELAAKGNYILDVYAIEILTLGLRKIADSPESELDELLAKDIIESLLNNLMNVLYNTEDATKVSLLRIKTIYCSCIQLYCLSLKKIQFQVNLTAASYNTLVEILILVIFTSKSFLEDQDDTLHYHTLRNLEYQKMMFDELIKLHNTESVIIPNNVCWKLCIYFGLPNYKFQDQLTELLKVIANRSLNKYISILPVAIYKLSRQEPALSNHIIQKALKVHSDFIINQFEEQSISILKVHIVLNVLQMVDKYVTVVSIRTGVNRLVALRHLNVLVEDVHLNTDKAVLELIIEKAKVIGEKLLTHDEKIELFKFTQYFEKFLA